MRPLALSPSLEKLIQEKEKLIQEKEKRAKYKPSKAEQALRRRLKGQKRNALAESRANPGSERFLA